MSSSAPSPSTTASLAPQINITTSDHGPAVILTAAIMLGICVMTLGVRLYQRWPWAQRLKFEDAWLILATVSSISNVIAAGFAVHAGLGKHSHTLDTYRIAQTRSALTATFTTAFVTQGLTAGFFANSMSNLTPSEVYKKVTLGFAAFTALWILAAIFYFGIEDDTSLPQSIRSSWISFAVLSVLSQIAEAALAVWLIWPLNLRIAKRIEMLSWFLIGIPPIIAAIVLRLVYTPSLTFGDDFTWNDTIMVIILLIETNMMCVSAMCPSLRNLLTSVSTGFLIAETMGDVTARDGSRTYGSGARSHGLRSLKLRPGDGKTLTFIAANGTELSGKTSSTAKGDTTSVKSFGSQAIMVRTELEVENSSFSVDNRSILGKS